MVYRQVPFTGSTHYADLSRPLEVHGGLSLGRPATARVVIGIHSQTLLFLVVAVLVGGALLMVVPNFSATVSTSESGSSELAESSLSETVATDTIPVQASGTTKMDTGVGEMQAISPLFTREVQHWAPKIIEWSKLYNLDPDIIATIMQIESCGDPGAASYAGAQGLFQVMPFHFDAGEQMLDPDTNARRGMAFFNRQLEYTGGDIYLSFAGYNGGYAASGSSYSYWANETQRYYMWAKGIYDDAKAGLTESPTLQQWLAAGGGGGCQRAAERLGL